jgi:radical SAM protein with 4Fe4S-binding SPASM domain
VRLAAELGVDEVVVTHYMPSFEGQRFQSLFYHRRLANQMFADARAIADACGVTLQLPPPYPVPSLSDEPSLRVKVKDRYGRDLEPRRPSDSPRPCHHPWTSVSIDEKGDVYPCCQSNLLMGNLSTSSFEAIWNNSRYRKLRRTVNTDRAPSDCQRCVLRGETFTSVGCSDGSFFLRNLDLPTWRNDPRHARAREWLARTRLGRWIWGWGRKAYKNFFEWHFA